MKKETYHILYAANDAYAFLAGVSMLSLFENNKDLETIRVSVLDDGIGKENKEKLIGIADSYRRTIDFFQTTAIQKQFQNTGATGYAITQGDNSGLTVFSRFAAGDLFRESERVLYLDCDTLINGSIKGLYGKDMNGLPVAMAFDPLHSRYKQYIGMPKTGKYFNSGVILFDISEWNRRNCFTRILEHLKKVRGNYPLPDQDCLNMVLGAECGLLDMKYNYLSQYFLYDYKGNLRVYEHEEDACVGGYWKAEQWLPAKEAAEKVVVFHFSGGTLIRPWYSNSRHPMRHLYRRYLSKSPWGGYGRHLSGVGMFIRTLYSII